MRKGFIFTADAIFSLAMLGAVALMFSVYSAQPEYSAKATLLQGLAYDFVVLQQPPVNLDAATFKAKTGFNVTTDPDSVPRSGLVVRATKYIYNDSCADKDCSTSCKITKVQAGSSGSGCLVDQSIETNGLISSTAWVSAP
jgi:hypothetical protein